MSFRDWTSRVPIRGLRVGVAAAVLALVVASGGLTAATAAGTSGTGETFLVLAPGGQGTARAGARVEANGGTGVASYDAIGVVIAQADGAGFAQAVVGGGVQSAASTSGLGTPIETDTEASVDAPDPVTTSEPLWGQQWDM